MAQPRMKGLEDLQFGSLEYLRVSIEAKHIKDNQFSWKFGDCTRMISEIENINCGCHSPKTHDNILPFIFPCETGTQKCIHEGYEKTLRQVIAELAEASRLWIAYAPVHGKLRFYEMSPVLVEIFRCVLDGAVFLLEQKLEFGAITVDDVVFSQDDTEYRNPRIIDCIVTGKASGKGKANRDVVLSSLATMITDEFTQGNPHIKQYIKNNPEIQSIIKCLRGFGAHLHGIDNDSKHRERKLVSHPLFLDLSGKCDYTCKLRNEFKKSTRRNDMKKLKVSEILGNRVYVLEHFVNNHDGRRKVSRGATYQNAGWKILFEPAYCPEVMLLQKLESEKRESERRWRCQQYNGEFVSNLVNLFRDVIIHVNENRKKVDPNSVDITESQIGIYIKQICPELLSYTFEEFVL